MCSRTLGVEAAGKLTMRKSRTGKSYDGDGYIVVIELDTKCSDISSVHASDIIILVRMCSSRTVLNKNNASGSVKRLKDDPAYPSLP